MQTLRPVIPSRLACVLSALAGVLLVCLALAPAAGAEVYGFGDAPGEFAHCNLPTSNCCYADSDTCPAGSVSGFWNAPLFQDLIGPDSAHPITEERLFVAYDAIDQFNGSTTDPVCTISRVLTQPWEDPAGRWHPPGQAWQNLLAELEQAHADGLTPVVSIAGYSSPAAVPAFDQPAPDPTTVAGAWEYRCGLLGILGAVSRLPTDEQPHIWEAFNEPDVLRIFRRPATDAAVTGQGPANAPTTPSPPPGCAVGPTPAADGPAKAACLYVAADQVIHGFAGHADDTILAGAFSKPSTAYLAAYAAQLTQDLPGAQFPTTWAVHDYADVGRSFDGPVLGPMTAFDQALAHDSGGLAADLWVTESGAVLTSIAPENPCPATATNAAHTLGACLSGQPARQAADAAAFFKLAQAGTAVPITHLFWFQWSGEPGWDSGLTDPSGAPRPAYCVFFGAGVCTGNPSAA